MALGMNGVSVLGFCILMLLSFQQALAQNNLSAIGWKTPCEDDSPELRDVNDDNEMHQKILLALENFNAHPGPDPNRKWVRGSAQTAGESKYACDQFMETNQSLHRLDFTVLTQDEIDRLDLRGACVRKSRLKGLDLRKAKLAGANFYGSCLKETILSGVDLSAAILERTDLERADLEDVILDRAILSRTNFTNAYFAGDRLSLKGTIYETEGIPFVFGLDQAADDLASLRSENSPEGLSRLRVILRNAGFQKADRAVTYAIERQRTEESGWLERTFRVVLFEWPTQYGRYPGHALWALLYLWVGFSFIYAAIIFLGSERMGVISKFYPKPDESVRYFHDDSRKAPVEIPSRLPAPAFAWGAYFSLVTALHIGWRDINFGEWLMRMNPGEFTLRATNYVRTLTTIQSVISVYLVAMWVLTYFGRPFG